MVKQFFEANKTLALDQAESKLSGGKIDPTTMRDKNEKITDAARDQFEKATG